MYQIELLNRLLKEYKLWTIKLISTTKDIKNNILQTGSGKEIEEKIASIAIAWVAVYIATGILSFLGLYSGEFILVVVFSILGLFLSKFINKKIFGVERNEEDLKDDEKNLLANLEKINNTHIDIRAKINNGLVAVNFCDYVELKKQFQTILGELKNYNTNHLAYKYRVAHQIIVSKYNSQIKRFDEIYANK